MTTPQDEHAHDIREPGPGEVSYAGMGIWTVKPIPKRWRDALYALACDIPALGEQPDIARLIAAPTIEEEANGQPPVEEAMKVCKITVSAPGSDGEMDVILTKEQYKFLLDLFIDFNNANTFHAQPTLDIKGRDRTSDKP